MTDIALDHGLHQIVDKPTRENNILDLCFTNDLSFVKSVRVIDGISDHDIVIVAALVRPKLVHKPRRKVFIYAKGEYNKICDDLNAFNSKLTDDYVEKSDINQIWTDFTSIVQKSMDNNIPSKMSTSKVRLPWMNDRMRKKCNKNANFMTKLAELVILDYGTNTKISDEKMIGN
jgi:hypothetical protein